MAGPGLDSHGFARKREWHECRARRQVGNAIAVPADPVNRQAFHHEGAITAEAARVQLVQGDLACALAGPFDVLLANPPYIAESERPELPTDVLDHEPHLALFAARDGLAVVERLIDEGAAIVAPDGLLALELGAGQGDTALTRLAADPRWVGGEVRKDLAGRSRMLIARRSQEGTP